MKMPNEETVFLPLSEIEKYSDPEKYYCCGVVFEPETENNHFHKCPPYIEIGYNDYSKEQEHLYFEVPKIIAYYAKTHPCYTMAGSERKRQQGRRDMANELKKLLNI